MKLLLDEPERRAVLDAIEDGGAWATSRLSYVECGAAIGRAHREGRVASRRWAEMLVQLDETWQGVTVVELDGGIAETAVEIARDHPVRASDSLHLASALAIVPPGGTLTFVCYDRRLWEAADALGMERLPAEL